MKVFISWSGEQSREIALALRDWLPLMVQAVKPYMSEQDNEAGRRWEAIIAAELVETDFGILCLTPQNLNSPWINFEAGALSKAVNRSSVVPLLYHPLKPSDVPPPLGNFMAKTLSSNGILDILRAINKRIESDRRLEDWTLTRTFEKMWPDLSSRLELLKDRSPADELASQRPERQILEEILGLVRQQQAETSKASNDASEEILALLRQEIAEGKVVHAAVLSLLDRQANDGSSRSALLDALGLNRKTRSTSPMPEGKDLDEVEPTHNRGHKGTSSAGPPSISSAINGFVDQLNAILHAKEGQVAVLADDSIVVTLDYKHDSESDYEEVNRVIYEAARQGITVIAEAVPDDSA